MKKVLVVDDDPLQRRLERATLGHYGALQVLEASDGATALALLQTERPDVVVLDIVNGGAACQPR